MAFRADQKPALCEVRFSILPAAPKMMDERFFHKVRPTALRAGLIGVEPSGTAFAAQVRTCEMTPL
jgi:hypothetical protein